jgi:hypothetical protein
MSTTETVPARARRIFSEHGGMLRTSNAIHLSEEILDEYKAVLGRLKVRRETIGR